MYLASYHVSYIRISTTNLIQADEFYDNVMGLSTISRNVEEGYILYSISGITLILETAGKNDELQPGRYLGISLKVRDIFRTYKKFFDLGVQFSQPPEKQFWGGYLTEFFDPDKNVWTLLG